MIVALALPDHAALASGVQMSVGDNTHTAASPSQLKVTKITQYKAFKKQLKRA